MNISRKSFVTAACVSGVAMMLGGCGTGYSWRSRVPQDLRTVSVPTLRNDSEVMEAGAVTARQIAREIQREGTFSLRGTDDAVLEIQGRVVSASAGSSGYNRRSGLRLQAYTMSLKAEITVVDHRAGRLLIENRPYVGETTFTVGQDASTAQRDAVGRAADDLARRVVDDLLRFDFEAAGKKREDDSKGERNE